MLSKIFGSPVVKIIFAALAIGNAIGDIGYASIELKQKKEVKKNEDNERAS